MGSLTCDCDADILADVADLPGIECDAGGGGYRVLTVVQDDWTVHSTPVQCSSIQIDPATGGLWAPRQRVIGDIFERNYTFALPSDAHVPANDWLCSLPLDYTTAYANTHHDTISTSALNYITVDMIGISGSTSVAEVFGAGHPLPEEGLLTRVVCGAEVDLQFGSSTTDTLEARLQLQLNGGLQWPFSPTFLVDYGYRQAPSPNAKTSFNLYGEAFVILRSSDSPTTDTITASAGVQVKATGHTGTVLALRSCWVAIEMN